LILLLNNMSNSSCRSRSPIIIESLETRTLLSSAPTGLSPKQISAAYGWDQAYLVKNHVHYVANGTAQTIAIIDAYHDPYIKHDVRVFDRQFGISDYAIPQKKIDAVRVAAPFGVPQTDTGWALESSLDVEWAHAVAPKARIMLVEALSPSINDLLNALDWARNIPGVSVISMSWGGQEFRYESFYDQYLTTPPGHIGGNGKPGGITFISSAGDAGSGTSWPAASPNVIAVGGTTLDVTSTGQYQDESAWNGSGGGISYIERTYAPDVAYDADPQTGFSVYDSMPGSDTVGWQTVGGTSAGAPQWAGLFAIADQNMALHKKPSLTETQALNAIYAVPSRDFHDITTGDNGGYMATAGTDLVTGRGSPFADRLINDLWYYA
jgi:subtilase family serine protease